MAPEVAGWLTQGLLRALPDATVIAHPLTDGGEGTLDVLSATGWTLHSCAVVDSFGRPLQARFAGNGARIVIESAEAFGFLPDAKPEDALSASSYGVGLLIQSALDLSPQSITLTVGGTSGSDGGAGMLQALGAKLLDDTGAEIGPGGGQLHRLEHIDMSGLDSRLSDVALRVVTDVTNPLLGDQGAASIFAPQKGADSQAVNVLEQGLSHFAAVLDPAWVTHPGSGAGGGLAYGALAGLGASLGSGATEMITLTQWDGALEGCDLVITGEGSFDDQSLVGKITGTVIQRAHTAGVPVVVVCGVSALSALPAGVEVIELSAWAPDQATSLAQAGSFLEMAAHHIAQGL